MLSKDKKKKRPKVGLYVENIKKYTLWMSLCKKIGTVKSSNSQNELAFAIIPFFLPAHEDQDPTRKSVPSIDGRVPTQETNYSCSNGKRDSRSKCNRGTKSHER